VRVAVLILLVVALLPGVERRAEGIPDWVLPGIVAVESSSYWRGTTLVYVNRKRGRHGERGPTQMTRAAFDTVARPGESFARLSTDMDFAVELTVRYLRWLRRQSSNWDDAVAKYNGGLRATAAGNEYHEAVKDLGTAFLRN
jgi:hypothetical protein